MLSGGEAKPLDDAGCTEEKPLGIRPVHAEYGQEIVIVEVHAGAHFLQHVLDQHELVDAQPNIDDIVILAAKPHLADTILKSLLRTVQQVGETGQRTPRSADPTPQPCCALKP
jgi:hypothetical protein